MTKVLLTQEDHPHQSFEEFVVLIWKLEKRWHDTAWMDSKGGVCTHFCEPPEAMTARNFTCACGQQWVRELNGGWTTVLPTT